MYDNFFFQAEDGIRDVAVTGVQTCALPIYSAASGAPAWTWYTLPDPQHGGWWGKWSRTTGEGEDLHRDIAKEKADSAKYADAWQHGGGSMWMTPAYDDATKTDRKSVV